MNWHGPTLDPSPLEFAAACEEMRRYWSVDDRARRWQGLDDSHAARGGLPGGWRLPAIHVETEVLRALPQ